MSREFVMLTNTRDTVFEKVVLAVEQTAYIGGEQRYSHFPPCR